MDADYIYPTKGSRVRRVGAMAVVLVVFVAAAIGSRLLAKHVTPLPVCEQIGWLQLAIALVVLAALVPAIVFANKTYKIYKHRQYPPPGAAVFLRTKIQRGLGALVQGLTTAVVSAFFFFLVAYVAVSDTAHVIFLSHSCSA
jgi:amino acid transporter